MHSSCPVIIVIHETDLTYRGPLTQPATAAHYFDKNDINVFTVRFGTSLQIELLTEPVARRMASL